MLIDKDHPALQGGNKDFIKDEIDNSRILIYEIDKAIIFLTKNKYSRYTIDTGQTQMSVQYNDLAALYDRRKDLLDQIAAMENQSGERPSAFIVRPL